MYSIKQNNDKTTIKFIQPSAELLRKTSPYETAGVKNVMKTMASEFLHKERTDFFVNVIKLERWFHFKTRKDRDIVYVELTDVLIDLGNLSKIYANGSYGKYENNGLLTKETL